MHYSKVTVRIEKKVNGFEIKEYIILMFLIFSYLHILFTTDYLKLVFHCYAYVLVEFATKIRIITIV